MRKAAYCLIVAIFSCHQINNTSQDIQPQELIGTWSATHVSVERCVMNGDTLPPDTGVYKSTYWIYPDSIQICLRQIEQSPCGIIPLPICIPVGKQWTTEHDTLFVNPFSSGTSISPAKFGLSRYASGRIIFSSERSIDTCSRE
jgi:hypothetical protein